MSHPARMAPVAAGLVSALVIAGSMGGRAQSAPVPVINDAPNPYRAVENWAMLPEGRKWGATSAVDIAKDGKGVWVAERCGGNSACLDSPNVDRSNTPRSDRKCTAGERS